RDDGEHRREVGPSWYPFLDHERAREHVAEALASARHHRCDQSGWHADQVEWWQPDLDKGSQEGSHQRLPEPFWAAVITDHANANRHLAKRLAPAERFKDERISDHDEQQPSDINGSRRRLVQVAGRAREHDDRKED